MRMKNIILVLFIVHLSAVLPLFAQKKKAKKEGEWDASTAFTYYYDSREFGTLNILTSAKGLPMDLFFWGFTDFHGNHQSDSGPTDFTRYFMEYRLLKGLVPNGLWGLMDWVSLPNTMI